MNTKLLIAIQTACLLMTTNLFADYNSYCSTILGCSSGYQDNSGNCGEFTAFCSGGNNYCQDYSSQCQINNNGQEGFQTFCCEMTTPLCTGQSCNATVCNSIISGPGSSTAITVGTAYLYSCFSQGILQGYNYKTGTGRETCADELQDAVWYFQGEINSGNVNDTSCSLYKFNLYNPDSDPFIALCKKLFGSKCTESDVTYGNNFGVCGLNLTCTVNGKLQYCQDELCYCPTAPVPEPATFAAGAMLLVPLGISGFRAIRKKLSA